MTHTTISPAQRREYERMPVVLPVKLDQYTGMTQDVSAGGCFFEIDHAPLVGSEISCELELDTLDLTLVFQCKGTVIRTVPRGAKTGVAIRIDDSRMHVRNPPMMVM